MKKLMIAAAIVCAAVVSQAATVNWAAGKLTGPASAESGAATGAALNKINNSSWLITLNILSANDPTAIIASDTLTLTVDDKGNSAISSNTKGGNVTKWDLTYGPKVSGSTFSSLADETGYYYQLIVEGTTADYTAKKESAVTAFETAAAGGSADLNASSATKLGTAWTGAAWTVSAVPEPTSGLLLLLGVAGLALKRKRA